MFRANTLPGWLEPPEFAVISPRHADASETNAAASPATNAISISISAGHQNADG